MWRGSRMRGPHLCRHGTPVAECTVCSSKKKTCRGCGRGRYSMRSVRLPDKAVELRELSSPLIKWGSLYTPAPTIVKFVVQMFPLCQTCWRSMTPDARLSYFRSLWLESSPGPQHLEEWFAIEAAVLGEV